VSSSVLTIKTAEVFEPLLAPARYKGAWGGRGSGKSHFFGELAVEEAVRFPGDFGEGMRMVCIREVQKDLSQSSKLLIEDKLGKYGLGSADGFKVWKDRIETPKDGIIIFKGMNDYTAESAKSLERFKRAWIDEAQTLSARSLSLLRPTIHRWDDAEIWASWNPTRKSDAIDEFFRGQGGAPRGAAVVEANWRDNPFWSHGAEEERQLELERYPDRYPHTYDGEYARAFEGAYFGRMLAQAKAQGRIGRVSADPLLPIRAFHDIGGSGAGADAYTIWIVQWVGQEIRILDYYEAVGQVLAFHVNWMREHGYEKAINYLPHDGVNENNVTGKRYEDHWRDAGFTVEPPVKNQGRGAAAMRIEAVRRLGPKMWWNEATTEPGRDAVGFYHEKKDDVRNVGLGPEHDWSSHAADALGLMAVVYEEPGRAADFNRVMKYLDQGYV
jgi:phage terminase large subunit